MRYLVGSVIGVAFWFLTVRSFLDFAFSPEGWRGLGGLDWAETFVGEALLLHQATLILCILVGAILGAILADPIAGGGRNRNPS